MAFFFLMILCGCEKTPSDDFPRSIDLPTDSLRYQFSLQEESDSLFVLKTVLDPAIREIRDFRIPFPVYQFQAGDVNQNGQPDCLVGVIKSTPFDAVLRRRLFIYELRGIRFHKLWEGSRLVHPIAEFRLVSDRNPPEVWSMEFEQEKDLYCVARYRMGSFGLELIDYFGRNLEAEQAKTLFEP